MDASIRAARPEDAPMLLKLAIELGYANDLYEIRDRVVDLAARPEHAVLVAERDGALVAFMHLRVSHQLESASYAEIAGLIVGEKARGSGVGTRLLAEAEAWARARDVRSLRVRSNLNRTRTHAFYRKLGFEDLKDQKTFIRRLGS
jgi:N-acetylglutamate synthase-like GNAT family acetyltransferase